MRRTALSLLAALPLALGGLVAVTAPAHAADTDVKINEVESTDGITDDWVELINTGTGPVDIGGWVVKDDGEGNNTSVQVGVVLAAGARYVVNMSGLGGNDQARLFDDAAVLIDSVSWATHASTTLSRCPETAAGTLTANQVGTKWLANACTPAAAWPGGAAVFPVDVPNAFGGDDVSGLAYEGSGGTAPGTIWAVQNGSGFLYKVAKTGATWAPSSNWDLNYITGLGTPDAEGVTITDAGSAGGVYVATERDGANDTVSRPTILRYVPTGSGTDVPLTATNEWNLTADLPGLVPNYGPEAIAWVPDSYLMSRGLKKDGGAAYSPADFPNHGNGLFFVGIEQTGQVIGYALNHATDTFTRVVTIEQVMSSVMDLVYDPELQKLWVACDDNCGGRTALLDVSTSAGPTQGTFVVASMHARPANVIANLNNEGFAVAPLSECVGGTKPVFWADDGNTGSNTLRAGTLNCGTAPTISGAASSSKAKSAAGWYGAPVTVTFSCTPGSAPINGGCPATVTLSTSGADQAVSRTVTNGHGLTATVSASNLDIDLVAPTVKITGVKKGKTYPKKKKPKCVGTDALSGLASCTVVQKKKGSKYTVTATATDKAGNVTAVTLTYKVKKPKS